MRIELNLAHLSNGIITSFFHPIFTMNGSSGSPGFAQKTGNLMRQTPGYGNILERFQGK